MTVFDENALCCRRLMSTVSFGAELQVKLDETEQMALKGGKKQLHKLESRVRTQQERELRCLT